jgi:hypothetical protein
MSAWRDFVASWFEKHDETFLAEKLVRACEDWKVTHRCQRECFAPACMAVQDALKAYRKQNPREGQ